LTQRGCSSELVWVRSALRMQYPKIFAFTLFAGILLASGISHTRGRSLDGVGIRYQIEQDFNVWRGHSSRELQNVVSRAIVQANPQLDGLRSGQVTRLARDLVKVSRCLQVDPLIMTALVWRESNFKPHAVSATGAVGLTQMTVSGIQEVLERTHTQGFRRLKYGQVLMRRCAPELSNKLAKKWSQTFKRDQIYHIKATLPGQHEESLIWGALLLKLHLASAGVELPILERYRVALERYNGDQRVKSSFAKDILWRSQALTSGLIPGLRRGAAVAVNGSRSRPLSSAL
jgi:hypothetical protein